MPHNMRRAAVATVASLGLAACLTACSSNSKAGSADGSKKLSVSLLTTYNGLPFYTAMQCGAQDAAAKLGNVSLKVDGPNKGMNAADQVPVLESVVNRHPDGLIYVPADPKAMIAPIQTAISSGITVVTTDGLLDKQLAAAQFHADNKEGGKLAADEMKKLAGGKSGKILVLDNRPGLPIVNDRATGFIDALKQEAPELEALPTQYFQDDPNKAATIVQGELQAHPDIVGIFADAEAGATGAVSGLKGAGSAADKVSVIGYDAGPALVDALKAGTLDALVAQGSYQQGYDAMTALVQKIRSGATGVPFDNIVPNVLVNRDNIDQPDIQKALYPTKCS
jgi:ribose transport system substrate-binding protein